MKKLWGYTTDPNREKVKAVQKMKWEDIENFYKEYIQGKPVTIMIVGDPKRIDQKALTNQYGKIKKLTKQTLFAPIELDFIVAE